MERPERTRLLGRRLVHQGQIIRVEACTIAHPDGHVGVYDVVSHVGAAAVVAVDEHGYLILVAQDRWAVGAVTLELPAGRRDEGESLAACAARELTEEVGLVASKLIHLGDIYTTPGFCSEQIGLYLADGLTAGQQHLDAHEDLAVVRLPLAQAVAMAEQGELTDAKTIIGILRAAKRLGDMPQKRKPS